MFTWPRSLCHTSPLPGQVQASRDTSWCPGTCPGVPRIVAGLRLHTTGRRRLFTYCHQHTLQSSHQHTVHPTKTFSLRRRRAISSDTRRWVDGFRIALCSELNQSSVILYNDTMTVPSRTYVSNDDVHSSTEYAKHLLIWLIVGGLRSSVLWRCVVCEIPVSQGSLQLNTSVPATTAVRYGNVRYDPIW